jgi:hypothetical protein
MAPKPPGEGEPTRGPKARPKAKIPGFDPKAEDWQKRGRANFVDRKTVSRPFKGGGRGR